MLRDLDESNGCDCGFALVQTYDIFGKWECEKRRKRANNVISCWFEPLITIKAKHTYTMEKYGRWMVPELNAEISDL